MEESLNFLIYRIKEFLIASYICFLKKIPSFGSKPIDHIFIEATIFSLGIFNSFITLANTFSPAPKPYISVVSKKFIQFSKAFLSFL